MKTKIIKIAFLALIVLLAGSASANNCYFNRDLGIGSRGEDVRCLQQYLRSYSYGYGNADGVYGPMTMQAVINWQASNGVYPTSGYFDSVSRSKYSRMFSLTNTNTFGSVLGASTTVSSYSTTTYSSQENMAREKIEKALDEIDDAQDEIDDSNQSTTAAEKKLKNAYNDIFDAIRAFIIDRDYNDAFDYADDALENAEDASDEVDGKSDRDSAEDAIDDADEAIDDAQDDIDDAEDRGQYVEEANDLLDDAREALDDAEDEFDDAHYDDAEDLAREAQDLVDEALSEIN
ncbi:MAG: peptidoglycan-binding protein [Candidatus Pacebacteria bacterium]|nr:peptidoglycan-binding protein [Candidatus Paceibacterota bacterium]